ncbi:MAG: hypothetical protein Q7V43_04905 [Myxococcales bacterium]|nr:hypothetical protein [Myxococcales bacterium]
MLGFTYSWLAPSLSTDVYATKVWAIGGGACGVLIVVAWLVVVRRCLAPTSSCPSTFPDDARAMRRAALGVAWIGALSCIVADEPLWPLTVGVLGVDVAFALRTLRREADARRWLCDVAAGRTSWTLRPTGDPGDGRAWLVAPRGESAYRGVDAVEAVALVVATPPRREALALHGVGLALCLLGAACNHGYVDLSPPARDGLGLRGLFRDSARSFIIDRAPPESVWTRVRRHKSLRRLGHYRIPGVELWRDCKFSSCRGVTIATDERAACSTRARSRLRRAARGCHPRCLVIVSDASITALGRNAPKRPEHGPGNVGEMWEDPPRTHFEREEGGWCRRAGVDRTASPSLMHVGPVSNPLDVAAIDVRRIVAGRPVEEHVPAQEAASTVDPELPRSSW